MKKAICSNSKGVQHSGKDCVCGGHNTNNGDRQSSTKKRAKNKKQRRKLGRPRTTR